MWQSSFRPAMEQLPSMQLCSCIARAASDAAWFLHAFLPSVATMSLDEHFLGGCGWLVPAPSLRKSRNNSFVRLKAVMTYFALQVWSFVQQMLLQEIKHD